MTPSEVTSMPAKNGPSPDDETRSLRDEVVALARALPGDLRRLTVRAGDRAIEVEWAPDTPGARPAEGRPARPVPVPDEPAPAEPDAPEGSIAVRAPLVGTYYAAPSPGADAFVRVGDEVEPGQTLGIVEAMKLMNPIVADEAGMVTGILVGDAESVEYDQVLMHLRPSGGPR
jgi:acetyl-CoA carboxylase biotin carboxyl carrier protein